MKSKYWLILFAIDALLHVVTTIYSLPTLNFITKPLLMILLAGYFIAEIGKQSRLLKKMVLVALGFSWFGDTFLMFQQDNPLFFILGLSSFLLAHIAYILCFRKFRNAVSFRSIIVITILFAAYSLVLANLLWLGLGDMKIPVLVYAFVITIMGIIGFVKNLRVNNLILVGVALFIFSDSMIAYTKFVEPIEFSRLLIMSTYILAQFLIVKGLSQRIFNH